MSRNSFRRTARVCAGLAALCAILVWGARPAGAQEAGAEARYLENITAEAMALSELPSGSDELEVGIEGLLDTHFDLPRVARALLGRYWRRIPPDQREAYAEAFRKYVVRQISSLVPAFKEATVTVLRTTRRSENDVIVHTRVLSPVKSPRLVDWRMRTGEGGVPRIVDISFEGASLFSIVRAEFQSIVADQGVDALIASIEKLAASAK